MQEDVIKNLIIRSIAVLDHLNFNAHVSGYFQSYVSGH